MDVDLLRPGTVPIAPETVLWFEFLLHHDLLLSHLQKPSPDPSATELISKFYDVITDTLRIRLESENNEAIIVENIHDNTKQPAKNIALKILALKIAAYIKWNLSLIRSLPFKTQIHLLQDLLYFTNDRTTAEIPNIDVGNQNEGVPAPYLFALVVYHRWLLNISMHRITSNWNIRIGNGDISPAEENIICSHENIKKTVEFLNKCLTWGDVPSMLAFDCFKIPSENNDLEFDWAQSQTISKEEFRAQLNYDLGVFFFYKEDYGAAKENFLSCLTNFKAIKNNGGFANFESNTLEMYVRACTGPTDGSKGNLLEQFNSSVVNHYTGITTVLQQDNVYREIPLAHRISLELTIQGALSSGTFTVARDLLCKIRALNIVRCVLDQKPIYHCSVSSLKSLDTLIWAVEVTWKSLSTNDQELLKKYLFQLILRREVPELLSLIQNNAVLSNIFDKRELQYIIKSEPVVEIPASLNKPNWTLYDFSKRRKLKPELKQLEQDLIATYDHKEIREVLKKISMHQLAANVWNINPQWELPIPLQSVIKSLPRGFLQDFSFVMLSKAREQMSNKVWNSSLELMLILEKELSSSSGNMSKLSVLISWEILLVQITQLLEEWPKSGIDKVALANACEACLQTSESVLPRTEITEHCIICLLNLGRWEFLINFDKRWPSFEIFSAIALACQELVKHKGNKKLSKNLWDIVLPIFTNASSQSKRGSSGSSTFYDSHLGNLKNSIIGIFSKLRDSTVLTVIISMLARLYNVLKDESSLELQVEYTMLWPAVVSNANSYNTKTTCEFLSQIVSQGLKYYPNNIPWLRLMGDINFVIGHYDNSLKYYLKSLLIYHDYFNIPVRHDDHVFRRMIKCSIALGCNTQAAVLCQFLEEPDYVLAFRVLGEQKYFNDTADSYYHCIWDTSILEYLIHIHNKRGEYQRKKCAIQVIGMLELNSNNNEEIQREAINLRKSTFLRALCKQYVF